MASDLELLERWRAGESAAGEMLFERYFDAVARFFRNKVDQESEDLVQQTFLGCVRGQARWRGESSFRSYLFVIAHNVLKNHYRGQRRAGADVDFGVTSVHDLRPSPSMVAGSRREHGLLLDALRRIPLELQVALELHYWEGLSMTEIGDVLDMPAGTIKTRIRRAKQLLRDAMDTLTLAGGGRLTPTEADLDAWARGVRTELLRE